MRDVVKVVPSSLRTHPDPFGFQELDAFVQLVIWNLERDMKSLILRIATSLGIKKPGLIIADSVESFADAGKVQTTRAGRKINHTNPPVKVNALFDIRRQKSDLSHSNQRKPIHSSSQSSLVQKTGKSLLRVRDPINERVTR
jgi:hypothetical protein